MPSTSGCRAGPKHSPNIATPNIATPNIATRVCHPPAAATVDSGIRGKVFHTFSPPHPQPKPCPIPSTPRTTLDPAMNKPREISTSKRIPRGTCTKHAVTNAARARTYTPEQAITMCWMLLDDCMAVLCNAGPSCLHHPPCQSECHHTPPPSLFCRYSIPLHAACRTLVRRKCQEGTLPQCHPHAHCRTC
jgi:hypothetical protein